MPLARAAGRQYCRSPTKSGPAGQADSRSSLSQLYGLAAPSQSGDATLSIGPGAESRYRQSVRSGSRLWCLSGSYLHGLCAERRLLLRLGDGLADPHITRI